MREEHLFESYRSDVLEKYLNHPEQYTVINDRLIIERNKAWKLKYIRNSSAANSISVLKDDMQNIPNEEQQYWHIYIFGVAMMEKVTRR